LYQIYFHDNLYSDRRFGGITLDKNKALDFLKRIAEGIATTFGRSCETVIHDMKNKENSIIAIFNDHVTNRKVGDRLNILGTKKEVHDFLSGIDLVCCQGSTTDGKLIKSSTFHLIGDDYHFALGINFDYTTLAIAESALKELTHVGPSIDEALSGFGEHRLQTIFEECLELVGKPVSLMNKADRLRIVALLKERNAFSFQKSIPFISERLNISRYTLYNYLRELEDGK
jgi:predicted transcriptional regulator YheO